MLGPIVTGTMVGIPLGFLIGSLYTRKVMAPDYCPRCLQHKEWLKEIKEDDDKKIDDKKVLSRWYYHLRKRDKS